VLRTVNLCESNGYEFQAARFMVKIAVSNLAARPGLYAAPERRRTKALWAHSVPRQAGEWVGVYRNER
jgi:hypothetical protein